MKPLQKKILILTIVAIVLVMAVAAAIVLPQAWRRTQRGEAFLPSLEKESLEHPTDGALHALIGARYLLANRNADAVRELTAATENGISDPDVRAALNAAQGVGASPVDLSADAKPLFAAYGGGSSLDAWADSRAEGHIQDSGLSTRERWAARRPEDPVILRLWGQTLIGEGRLNEAATPLQHAAQLEPNSADTHHALADLLLAANRPARALEEYMTALKIRPNDLACLVGLGKALLNNGATAVARKVFTRVIDKDPNSLDAYLGRAYCTSGASLYAPQTIADFEKVGQLDPNRTSYLPTYANVLIQTGDYAKVETLMRRRLKRAPEDPVAHCLLGTALLRANPTPARLAEAEAETRKSLELAPGYPAAQEQLGDIQLNEDHPADAHATLTAALKLDAHNYKALQLLAQACRRTGRAAEAAQAAQNSTEEYHDAMRVNVLEDKESQDETNLAVHTELQSLYTKLGQPAKAQSETEVVNVLKHDPAHAADQINALDKAVDALLSPR